MRTKLCPGCNKEIEYRAKTCRDCFKTAKDHVCIDCGVVVRNRQDRCWDCHKKRIAVPERFCTDCGVKLPKYGDTVRCKKCLLRQISESAKEWICIDCKTPVNRKVKRCNDCDKAFRKGRSTYERTKEHNQKLSEKLRGRANIWNKGKKHKPETRRKMRAYWTDERRQERAKKWKGEKSPGYIHGNGRKPWPDEFSERLKTRIRKRDKHTCQMCQHQMMPRSRRQDVHHIDYDKQNCNPLNLITLCRSCHAKTNFNRAHWQKHFEQLQAQREHTGFHQENDTD